MSTFTRAIYCLTIFNLQLEIPISNSWKLGISNFQFHVPMQYCSLQHQTLLLSPVTSTTGYCFLLWLHPFILSGVISPLISSSILGTYRPGEFIFQSPIFCLYDTLHGVLKARILNWFAIPFSSGQDWSNLAHTETLLMTLVLFLQT